jgi:hypothetical protein
MVENFKLNGKKQQPEDILGISSETPENRRLGRRFLLPRFSIPGFRWLRIASRQAPRHRGASVGGIRNQAFRIPKNKRVTMRKVRQRNPRSRGFLFHLSEFAFRPVPFVASEAAKRVQYSPGCQGLGQAWQLVLRRNLWANIIHPGSLGLGFAQGGFVVPNT